MNDDPFCSLDYDEWNHKLIDYFFPSSTPTGTQVKLNLDDETLTHDLLGEKDDLITAVLLKAEDEGCATIQTLGTKLRKRWHQQVKNEPVEGKQPLPPFVAILGVYVLAVDYQQDDFKPHNFYDRLHALLEQPETRITGLKPSFKLWKSLEDWLKDCCRGRRGVFRTAHVGENQHIGIPKRQSLIVPRERPCLEKAFHKHQLIPGSNPEDRRLQDATKSADGLLVRTKNALKKWPTTSESRDLLDAVRVQFDNWDADTFLDSEDARAFDYLRLTLQLSVENEKITTGIFTTQLVPGLTDQEENPLTMTQPSGKFLTGEFTLLAGDRDSDRSILVDVANSPEWAEHISWFDPMSFAIASRKATLTRGKQRHLLFKRDDSHNQVFHEIQKSDLQPDQKYLLVNRNPLPDKCPSGLGTFVENLRWKQIGTIDAYYRPFAYLPDESGAEPEPKCRFEGGIPSVKGERAFFPFGLPDIRVTVPRGCKNVRLSAIGYQEDGGEHSLQLEGPTTICASEILGESSSTETVYRLPEVDEEIVRVNVCLGSAEPTDRTLRFFIDRFPVSDTLPEPVGRTRFGSITTANEDLEVCGITVCGNSDRQPRPDSFPVATTPLTQGSKVIPDDDVTIRLMQFMRIRGQVSWSDAKFRLPRCLRPMDPAKPRWLFVHEIQRFHALGILELEENPDRGGFNRVVALPPRLVLLPRLANRGWHGNTGPDTPYQALLVGCWMPKELEKIKRVAKRVGPELCCISAGEKGREYYTRSLFVHKERLDWLQAVAEEIGVPFDGDAPFACQLSRVLPSVTELAESPNWKPGEPLNYRPIKCFDPRNLCLVEPPPHQEDRFAFWECRDPDTTLWKFFLVEKNKGFLRVSDRQIGRWFVRRQLYPETPIPETQSTIEVPRELRFPLFLERMLTLSSGSAPELWRYAQAKSPFRFSGRREEFHIPEPPSKSRTDWRENNETCSGIFVRYPGVYDKVLTWSRGEGMPMIGVKTKSVSLATKAMR